MMKLTDEILHFFRNQSFVIVSTISRNGLIHNSCKGIIKIEKLGKVYLLDVYKGKTYNNLIENANISLTAVDEHKFRGYCLMGKANLIFDEKFAPSIMKAWQSRITSRITQRLLRNIREEKGHPRHPEALLPKPEYLIIVDVDGVEDLTPAHLRENRT